MTDKQSQQKAAHDSHSKSRQFHVGQSVMARNLRPGPKWIPGIIVQRLGPLSFLIETRDGQLWRRHVDHLKSVYSDQESEDDSNCDADNWELPNSGQSPTVAPESTESEGDAAERESDDAAELPSVPESTENNDSSGNSDDHRYPSRSRNPPNYYGH